MPHGDRTWSAPGLFYPLSALKSDSSDRGVGTARRDQMKYLGGFCFSDELRQAPCIHCGQWSTNGSNKSMAIQGVHSHSLGVIFGVGDSWNLGVLRFSASWQITREKEKGPVHLLSYRYPNISWNSPLPNRRPLQTNHLIQPFNKYFLSPYSALGTVGDMRDVVANGKMGLPLPLYVLLEVTSS